MILRDFFLWPAYCNFLLSCKVITGLDEKLDCIWHIWPWLITQVRPGWEGRPADHWPGPAGIWTRCFPPSQHWGWRWIKHMFIHGCFEMGPSQPKKTFANGIWCILQIVKRVFAVIWTDWNLMHVCVCPDDSFVWQFFASEQVALCSGIDHEG